MAFLKIEKCDRVAIVDDAHFNRLSQFKWYLTKPKTVVYRVFWNGKKYCHQSLAGEVMKSPKVMYDHIDRDPFNNIKSNLRECNHSQNRANSKKRQGLTSIYKGVSWRKKTKKWRASICLNRKIEDLGEFNSEIEAAAAYDVRARVLFGEFANPNFN